MGDKFLFHPPDAVKAALTEILTDCMWSGAPPYDVRIKDARGKKSGARYYCDEGGFQAEPLAGVEPLEPDGIELPMKVRVTNFSGRTQSYTVRREIPPQPPMRRLM